MPKPRSLGELEKLAHKCNADHRHLDHRAFELCVKCAHAYAEQKTHVLEAQITQVAEWAIVFGERIWKWLKEKDDFAHAGWQETIQHFKDCARAYGEQEIAKTQFYCGHEATLLEYANEVSSLRIERDALLAVANVAQKFLEWIDMSVSREYLAPVAYPNDLREALANPDVQRLVKGDQDAQV